MIRNYFRVFKKAGQNILGKIKVGSWQILLHSEKENWAKSRNVVHNGKQVLIATSLGGYNYASILESTLAVALTLRGAEVDILLCDKVLPACQMTKIGKITPHKLYEDSQVEICNSCINSGNELFKPLGIPIYYYSQLLNKKDKILAKKIATDIPTQEIQAFKLDNLSIGEHAYAGTLRYYAKGNLNGEVLGKYILRKFFKAALLSTFAIRKLLKIKKYDAVCFHHGIYVPQGIIGQVCRKEGIRVINWNPSYRKHSFIFSHNDSYHHTMISEPTSSWEKINFTNKLEKQTLDYLKNRWSGKEDWIFFHEKPEFNLKKLAGIIDFSRPLIGMLTNVMWDAQLHYPSNAFSNMLEWVKETISYFSKRSDLQLILRIHPAEITGLIPSRQPLLAEIKKMFPILPQNIYIIPPESNISTYSLMEKCNAVLIYSTKTGIELSSVGIPVIVAGEAWIRNKGFTYDIDNKIDYYKILDKLPFKKKLTSQQLMRARKYAYHFFFRRMIPLPFIVSPKKFTFDVKVQNIYDLLPGKYTGLDVICDGILYNRPFIYPAEKIDEKEN